MDVHDGAVDRPAARGVNHRTGDDPENWRGRPAGLRSAEAPHRRGGTLLDGDERNKRQCEKAEAHAGNNTLAPQSSQDAGARDAGGPHLIAANLQRRWPVGGAVEGPGRRMGYRILFNATAPSDGLSTPTRASREAPWSSTSYTRDTPTTASSAASSRLPRSRAHPQTAT